MVWSWTGRPANGESSRAMRAMDTLLADQQSGSGLDAAKIGPAGIHRAIRIHGALYLRAQVFPLGENQCIDLGVLGLAMILELEPVFEQRLEHRPILIAADFPRGLGDNIEWLGAKRIGYRRQIEQFGLKCHFD